MSIIKIGFLLFLMSVCISIFAQQPVVKVDINMEGRSVSEVNQEDYTPWFIARNNSATITVSGVKFTLLTTQPLSATMRCSWKKVLVQSPYFTRLANDGVKVDNDCLLAHPGIGAVMELHIEGLQIGSHSLQTYHNIWEDTTKTNFAPMNVYLNNKQIYSRVKRTNLVTQNTDATILNLQLNVTEADQKMVLRFEADTDFTPRPGKSKDLNVCLNAFELNTSDATKQAREPIPSDKNMNVDADSGFVKIQWLPAINNNTRSHTVYFGIDSAKVAAATTTNDAICKGTFPLETTEFKVEDLYNLNIYYWRVDETDSTGIITKGKVWSFKPRHLAFDGAEGYGRFAIGGRGGKVVYVTNLNDSGEGSFRAAVAGGTGPRTVVFNVSGIITLNSTLYCDDYITIAGQTAPGKGICLRKSSFAIGSQNICRFIRMRLGSGTATDGLGLPGASESILDHASISWSIDEGCTSRNAKNITIQKTLISEALNVAGLDNYEEGHMHGYAAVIGGDVGTFHHNLLAHCYGRNPRLDGGRDGSNYYAGRVDIFNNVIYNWYTSAAYGEAHEANFVNNYYKQGPATYKTTIFAADVNYRESNLGTESYYISGNVLELKNNSFLCDGSTPDCGCYYKLHGTMDFNWEIFVNKPFFPSYAKVETAQDAFKSVLSDVGCTMPMFDDHDKRIIDETKNGTSTYIGSISKLAGIIDTQDDVGGYEDYQDETRPENFDSDKDGLPDWWETLYNSNPFSTSGDFSDSNADPDMDGYTALEDYLQWMSVPHYFMEQNVRDTIDLFEYTAGYTSPTYNCNNAGNFQLIFNGSSVIVTPTSGVDGIHYLDIESSDQEGSQFIRKIGICIGVNEFSKITSLKNQVGCIVYPSSFNTQLNVELQSDKKSEVVILLCDLTGKTIIKNRVEVQQGNNKYTFNTPSNLPKQMYLVRVMDQNGNPNYPVLKVVKN